MWYNYNGILSYNALLNMIVGMRGGGKTYGAKKWAIRDFLRNGNQFMWVRRFNTELEISLKNFFSALHNDEDLLKEFGEIEYGVRGKNFYINGELAGFATSLSTSGQIRSTEFANVNKIIYDEFLIEKGSTSYYLKGEVEMLFSLIETVQRQRDNMRVILIANSVSFSNPYFMYFRIKPFNKEFLHVKDRSLVIHLYYNDEFANFKRNTRYGKLIKGSAYESYAIDNQFVDLSDTFIEKKNAYAKFLCSVRYESIDYGFWVDDTRGLMFASFDIDPSNNVKYVISEVEHDINYMLVSNYRATHMNEIMNYYSLGLLRFENTLVKSGTLMLLSVM